jgi:hypothetical protein
MEPARKFKIIVNSKEYGTCSGQTPSAVAKKVVKKLCGTSSKVVKFSLKECKRGCERVCGPYQGRMEKLDRPYTRDGKKITHRVVCGKVRKMRGGRKLKVQDFEKRKNDGEFRPEGYGFFEIPYIYFGDIITINNKQYYNLVIFNKQHLGNEIGISSFDGSDVSDVSNITYDIKNKLKILLTKLQENSNKYKRIQLFIKEKTNGRGNGRGNERGRERGRERGNVFEKLSTVDIKKYKFNEKMKELLKYNKNLPYLIYVKELLKYNKNLPYLIYVKELLKNNNNLSNLKYVKGYVFFGNRNGMYRYIIVSNQTYIPINDSEYIVLEELRYSSDKNKQSIYSEIMEDIKRTVSEISKENRTSIIANITTKNPDLLLRANTILS